MRGKSVFVAALIAVVLSGCARPPAPAAPPADAAAALLKADRDFAAASVATGTAQAFFDTMTADTLEIGADGPPVVGRDKVRDDLQSLGKHVLDWTPQKAEVSASGDMGWTWGEWRLLDAAGSAKVLAHGRYLNIWKHQADGAWKLAVDIGNKSKDAAGGQPG